jgi:cytochrome P450
MRRLVEQRFMEPIIKGDEADLAAPFAVAMRDAGMLGSTPGDLAANPRRRDAAIDQIAVMLLAGHETTASALSWLIWELAEQPERQEAAAAVFRGERPTGGPVSPWRGADPSALADALARESLRLYPPIAFLLRQTASDVVFRGKSVPAGNQFAIAPWTLHRHRRYWPRPDAFEPERWLAAGPLPKEARYIPFGKGARVCPGEKFAWVEMRAIIPTLLSRARLRLLDGRRPKPLGALTSRPNRDFPVSLELRPTL